MNGHSKELQMVMPAVIETEDYAFIEGDTKPSYGCVLNLGVHGELQMKRYIVSFPVPCDYLNRLEEEEFLKMASLKVSEEIKAIIKSERLPPPKKRLNKYKRRRMNSIFITLSEPHNVDTHLIYRHLGINE